MLIGNPADRPCLVDFANLLTKRLSLLECVNVVDDSVNWKDIEKMKANGIIWLQSNKIKAFYSVTRQSNFCTGARMALELSGLGKLKPNLLLVGFKDNWKSSYKETISYYKVLQSGFELQLSVAVLRISGGMNISNTANATNPVFPTANNTVDSIYKLISYLQNDQGFNSTEQTQVLKSSEGLEIQDANINFKMTQFRGENSFCGFIDVYWLYDDGGLTLLLPYILTTCKKFLQCKLRIFILGKKTEELEDEKENMAIFLSKFRIEFHEIITLATTKPGEEIRNQFNQMVVPLIRTNFSSEGEVQMTQFDLDQNSEKTDFHLSLAEIIQENSKCSSLIIMSLPIPKMDNSYPPGIYMAWLDIMTRKLPPFLLIHGNQESVLTFYS